MRSRSLLVAALLPLALAGAAAPGAEPANAVDAPPPTAGRMADGPGFPRPAPGATVTVTLKDGQSMHGIVLAWDPGGVTLDLGSGVRVTVPAGQIAEVREEAPGTRPGWRSDPNRGRYLYSPSGFMLRAGEAYFSQTELIFSALAYGVTDFLTLGIGAAIPAWFATDGFNLVGTIKFGGSVGEFVHLAAGAQAFWLPGIDQGASAGFLFATVTFGTPDLHLGISGGPPFAIGGGRGQLGNVLFSASGSWRAGRLFALVTENWFVPQSSSGLQVVNALAGRIFGDHIAVDIGFLRAAGVSYPIPWLDFTYNFR